MLCTNMICIESKYKDPDDGMFSEEYIRPMQLPLDKVMGVNTTIFVEHAKS